LRKSPGNDLPPGYYYAHVAVVSLTTHGLGMEGAREAARDLLQLWIAEMKANGAIDGGAVQESTK
jgi:hypothetical protein